MGKCPKCNSQVKFKAVRCPKCGAALNVQPLNETPSSTGTLNADDLAKMASDPNASDRPKPGGTLDPAEFRSSDIPPVGSGTIADVTASPPIVVTHEEAESDKRKTVALPDLGGEQKSDNKPNSTWIYGDDEKRGLSEGKGNSGSEGQLKRVWEAAIGSSGKDSKQSLRHERAEASDSVFRRVATRQVADANSKESAAADYQIQNKVGEGGMGIVFSAIQTAVNRVVAIKSIRADKRENDTARKQFFYEAEITAELDHPNIPPIYELGTTSDGLLFYSMKLIVGTEWQKLMAKKSREENLEIYNKIADAVAFAHSRDVIHRDLKPDNVMLGTYGEVYLTDWGLGINLSKRKSIDFGGTPDFMSPEMAANRPDKIGKASDIYLLGGILFQVITGMPPHVGRTPMDRLNAAKRNEIAPTNIDDPLLEIAMIAMSAEPADRYTSIGELQAAIGLVRKHAESIALAERSAETAKAAESSKDYDRFTRAIFGFRDAIDMWSDNKPAKTGLQSARYAYGQCAFDKGDYDLALQTLVRTVEKESKLYDKAAKAKLAVEQREQRFKTLRSVFVLAILGFLTISTALAGFASLKWRGEAVATTKAVEEATKAIDAKKVAEQETVKALAAEKTAIEAQKKEEIEKRRALAAEESANDARKKEELEKMRALAAEEKAVIAKESEEKQKLKAIDAEEAAVSSAKEARLAEKDAKQRAAQVQIGDAQSKTALARLQLEQFDVQGASKLLDEVKSVDASIFGDKLPQFDAWPLHRVNLLSNADLPKEELGGVVTAMDFALGRNIGVAGTADGKIHKISLDGKKLKVEQTITVPGSSIDAVAISPTGDEAVVTMTGNGKSEMRAWPLSGNELFKVSVLENRSFQQVIYSPDGTQLIAGINGGIWSWKRQGKWYSDTTEKQIEILSNVKGRLTQLQWIDRDTALAVSMLEKPVMYVLNINAKTSRSVDLPESLASALRVATFTGRGNRMLFGLSDGSLLSGNLVLSRNAEVRPTINDLSELPKKHRTAITQISVHPSGELITVSDEPVAHVWRVSEDRNVQYDTFLAGVPSTSASTNNLVRAAIIGDGLIAGIDKLGSAVLWDVERQKQRRQLTRSSERGAESYPAPILHVFNRGKTDQAFAVDSKGVVDLWSLQSGRTSKIEGLRWSYFGHTPGAEFADSAVDLNAGIVVTSASLMKADTRYLVDPSRTREFCVWNLKTGNMIYRWLDPSDEKITPRISLLADGQQILIASDSETRIIGLDGKSVFANKGMGTYFAISNPRDPNLVAMIKRSGLTWLWDRRSGWNAPTSGITSDGTDSEPAKAVWTEDGNRLFVANDNGRVFVYERKGNSLSLIRRASEADKPWVAFFGSGYRVPHHYDLDMAVSTVDKTSDRLYMNLRIPGSIPKSRQTQVVVSRDALAFGDQQIDEKEGTYWLDEPSHVAPLFTEKIHDRFGLGGKGKDGAVSRVKAGEHTLVSTRSAKVYDLVDKSSRLVSLGRQPMMSATSDRDGKSLLTLHKDGAIWKFELTADDKGQWSPVEYAGVGFTQIAISPDGEQLALLNESDGNLKIVNAATGVGIDEIAGVAVIGWDPQSDATLGIAFADGKVQRKSKAGKIELNGIMLKEGTKFKSLNFFSENWSNPATPPVRYVMVQTEDSVAGKVFFVPIGNAGEKLDDDNKTWQQSIGRGLKLRASPTESVFVTGEDSGTVTVWFASPTWEKAGRLFDLEGHQGAGIECIAFSNDGTTLMTSDRNNRLFGWLTVDVRTGK